MQPSEKIIRRIAIPIRGAANRFALLILVCISLSLMLLSRADYSPILKFQTTVVDVATPLLEIVAHPISTVNSAVSEIINLANIYDENLYLKTENERLRNWQSTARLLTQENIVLRDLLHTQPEPGITYVSGRIIGDSGGPFIRAVILNAGKRDGLKSGVAVVTGDGLVGRIVEVGERSSRVLLLTDLNSKIPVVVENSRYRAILSGNNSENLFLIFLPENEEVKLSDRIVTSGHGGLFPAGLPVGEVTKINGNIAEVTPYVRLDQLEFVRILLYNFSSLAPISNEDSFGISNPEVRER